MLRLVSQFFAGQLLSKPARRSKNILRGFEVAVNKKDGHEKSHSKNNQQRNGLVGQTLKLRSWTPTLIYLRMLSHAEMDKYVEEELPSSTNRSLINMAKVISLDRGKTRSNKGNVAEGEKTAPQRMTSKLSFKVCSSGCSTQPNPF